MSLEEFEKAPDSKTRRYILMRSITDFGMGFIYIGIGVLILFAKQLNFKNDFATTTLAKIFAAFAIIYGCWRVYRGFKKNYFKKND